MYLKSIENKKKFKSENLITYKICMATPRSQQLIYKGEIQYFIK